MIISNKHKYVYLACPKTGSSTTVNLLHDHYGGKYVRDSRGSYVGHKRDVPKKCENFFVFSTVRNPYPRMVSLWWEDTSGPMKKRRVWVRRKESYAWVDNKRFGMRFYDWLEHIRINKRQIFCSQTEFFSLVNLDCVVHLERFDQDFAKLPFVSSLPEIDVIGRAGESKGSLGHYGDYRDYYKDPKVAERLRELCHEDFRKFGYRLDEI